MTEYAAAVRDTITILRAMAQDIRDNPEQGRDQDLTLLVPLRGAGMLLQHVEGLLDAHGDDPVLLYQRDSVEALFTKWRAKADAELRPKPIAMQRLVEFQAAAILAAIEIATRTPDTHSGPPDPGPPVRRTTAHGGTTRQPS